MGFPRQEYWSGVLFPSPGHPPDPGIKLASPALAGRLYTLWATREAASDYGELPKAEEADRSLQAEQSEISRPGRHKPYPGIKSPNK